MDINNNCKISFFPVKKE